MTQVEDANLAVVRRFYDEVWNRWDLAVADEILAAGLRFRGSLGASLTGIDAFRAYAERTRAAFPDWHNQVDELIAAGDVVVARLTWTGTHRGTLLGIPPTGRAVRYVGAAIFRLEGGLIRDAWVVGDTQELWRAIGAMPPPDGGDSHTGRMSEGV
ncbi:MAG TPA: ester cyclase [Gaiellales bacterium]|nr:ester cyclase [Gaiellales bacterium]